MIRAVVWKELREQGLIAVMLAVLGGALLVAAAAFADPPSKSAASTDIVAAIGVGRLLALMLVVTAGMVCGGALFAAEKEAGTMTFLDTLPVQRWALWRAKIVAGVVLASAVVAVLLGVVSALGLGDGPFLRRLVVYALLAFAWGALGSTLARTTLGSVGIAISASSVAAFAFLFPIVLFLSRPGSGGPRPLGWALFEVLMFATPLFVSAWRFTAPDRARAADAAADAPALAGAGANLERPPGLGIGAVVWLTLRQLSVTGPVLSGFALVFGLTLLLSELRPLFVWPALAMTAGVLAGVTAFGDEQSHRTAIFWGEHRLPVGRVWFVKIGLHLLLLVWLLVLLALPGALRGQFDSEVRAGYGHTTLSGLFRSRLFIELGSQGWKYVLVPAAYGFAFGHVCGLLFRKLVVACGVAVMLGGVASAGWGPSLLAGGVKHWQVWVPAVVVLATGRLIVRAWASERAGDRGPVLRLVGAGALALAAFAVGLTYRVVEVPDDPTGADDTAFVATLPGYDENLAGNKFRAAAERYVRSAAQVPQDRQGAPPTRQRIDERLEQAIRTGWSADDADLGAWLDRLYAERPPAPDEPPWWEQAADAAAKPIGVYESPALANSAAATAAALDNARKMAVVILARGLQRQMAGDPHAFVPAFRTAVVLARNLRNGGGHLALVVGIDVERAALFAADGWLERLGAFVHASRTGAELVRALFGTEFGTEPERLVGVADLMTALAREAAGGDERESFDARPHLLSDRFVIRGIMQAPNQWLAGQLDVRGRDPEAAATEADLVALAWAVPWEKERTRRLIGLAPDTAPRNTLGALVAGRPGSALLARGRSATDVIDDEAHLRVTRRVAILKAAVLAFQIEHKRAPGPTELVAPGRLARLPDDPYVEGRAMGYRVSDGELLVGRARANTPGRPDEPLVVSVQAGQVVVWSVGPDRVDQGGKVPPGGPRAEDLVYVLPAPGALTK